MRRLSFIAADKRGDPLADKPAGSPMKPRIVRGHVWQPFPGQWVPAWECSTGEVVGRAATPQGAYNAWYKQLRMAVKHMGARRHVGGSILPSNDARVLKPEHDMQVRVIEEDDTHGLFRVSDGALLAVHPNGFSCRVLMDRLISGKRAVEQADFIVACGGVVTEEGWKAVGA